MNILKMIIYIIVIIVNEMYEQRKEYSLKNILIIYLYLLIDINIINRYKEWLKIINIYEYNNN